MAAGLSGPRTGKLVAGLGVPLLTLRRWRQWWLDDFVQTPLWRAKRGLFMPPADESRLPACLLPCFSAADEAGRWVLLLRFLAPPVQRDGGQGLRGPVTLRRGCR